MTALLMLLYIVGVIFMAWFNVGILVGGITYPWAIVRNALLWPICLPLLIVLWAYEMRDR